MKHCMVIMAIMGMALFAVACGGDNASGIEIQDAWVRAANAHPILPEEGADQPDLHSGGDMESMGGSNTASYLTILNNSSQPDRLLSAHSILPKAPSCTSVKKRTAL